MEEELFWLRCRIQWLDINIVSVAYVCVEPCNPLCAHCARVTFRVTTAKDVSLLIPPVCAPVVA